jgi:hypothetical protein
VRVAPSLAFIIGGFLAACSSPGGNNPFTGASNPFTVFVDPGQYLYLSCEQIATQRTTSTNRAQELKLLMDKAEQSTGGAIVNVIAYKSDYVSATEEIKVLDATAREKKCNTSVGQSKAAAPDDNKKGQATGSASHIAR